MAPLSFPFFKSHRASLSADSNPEQQCGQRDSGLSLASPLWCRGGALGTTENPGCPFTSIQAPRPSPPHWPPAHRSWTLGTVGDPCWPCPWPSSCLSTPPLGFWICFSFVSRCPEPLSPHLCSPGLSFSAPLLGTPDSHTRAGTLVCSHKTRHASVMACRCVIKSPSV